MRRPNRWKSWVWLLGLLTSGCDLRAPAESPGKNSGPRGDARAEGDRPSRVGPRRAGPATGEGAARSSQIVRSSLRGSGIDAADFRTGGGLTVEQAARRLARLLHEISRQRPLLAVWLVDRSPSARTLVTEFGHELGSTLRDRPLEKPSGTGEGAARPLLFAVGAVGEQVAFIIDPPRADLSELGVALGSVPVDESGRENLFAAVQAAVEKYMPIRTVEHREVVFILITDEAGDDDSQVDQVLDLPRLYGMPVYAVGVPAPFGRVAALPASVEAAGEAKAGEPWLPIRQGPESRSLERPQLGFWGGSTDLELLDSGFGPFGLERLCRATGGCFLALRPSAQDFSVFAEGLADWPAARIPRFDPEIMSRYAPDYVPADEYQRLVAANKARQALQAAAQMAALQLVEFPQLEFARQSEAELAQQLSRAQQVAAKLEPAVGTLYDTLAAGETERATLTGRRWQAGFDLALGRAAATKARIEGYNAMLAALKRGKSFANASSTRWVLEPAETIEASSTLERLADKAREYLDRVGKEHPGTPWALIAERERQTPIGWRWTEK